MSHQTSFISPIISYWHVKTGNKLCVRFGVKTWTIDAVWRWSCRSYRFCCIWWSRKSHPAWHISIHMYLFQFDTKLDNSGFAQCSLRRYGLPGCVTGDRSVDWLMISIWMKHPGDQDKGDICKTRKFIMVDLIQLKDSVKTLQTRISDSRRDRNLCNQAMILKLSSDIFRISWSGKRCVLQPSLNEIVEILQTLSNVSSSTIMFACRIKFHGKVFPKVQLMWRQWFRWLCAE